MHEQLNLFSHDLPSLTLDDIVLVRAEGWIGEVSQVWPGRDYYVVFSKRLSMHRPLPTYRRDELDLLPASYRAAVWVVSYAPPDSPERLAEEQRYAEVVARARREIVAHNEETQR